MAVKQSAPKKLAVKQPATANATTTAPAKRGQGKPFVEGDVRINRKGRPRTHNQLQALIQKIAWEDSPSFPDQSRLELMIRRMLASNSARDRIAIMEHAYGAVPKQVNATLEDRTSPAKLKKRRDERWAKVAPAIMAAALTEDTDGESIDGEGAGE